MENTEILQEPVLNSSGHHESYCVEGQSSPIVTKLHSELHREQRSFPLPDGSDAAPHEGICAMSTIANPNTSLAPYGHSDTWMDTSLQNPYKNVDVSDSSESPFNLTKSTEMGDSEAASTMNMSGSVILSTNNAADISLMEMSHSEASVPSYMSHIQAQVPLDWTSYNASSLEFSGVVQPEIGPGVPVDEAELNMSSQFYAHEGCLDKAQIYEQSQTEKLPKCTKTQPVLPPGLSEFISKIGLESTSMGQSFAGTQIAMAKKEFTQSKENYLRGCKWSPDGRCILTNSNDNVVRNFEFPDDVINGKWDVSNELPCRTKVHESELIYDFCWYSNMDSTQPETCCFATSCRDTPIHLFNSQTGELLCSYRSYNHVDEIVAAHSIGFAGQGTYVLAGFNKTIRIFHTSRPGRDFVQKSTTFKNKWTNETDGQPGIISCFAEHPTDHSLFAAGSFRGDVAIYSLPSGEMNSLFRGQIGGVTHVRFSEDGLRLFAGGRKDPEIICWDIRYPGNQLFVMYRYVQTNQRMYFDIDCSNKYLMSGNHNGKVSIWDLNSKPMENPYTHWPQINPVINFQAHADAVNGCSANRIYPFLASASGQRHFPINTCSGTDENDDPNDKTDDMEESEENTLKIWYLNFPEHAIDEQTVDDQ